MNNKTIKRKRGKKGGKAAKRNVAAFSLLAAMFLGALLLYYVSSNTGADKTGGMTPVELYFTNTLTNKWEFETRHIVNEEAEGGRAGMITRVFAELAEGPRRESLSKSIPDYLFDGASVKLIEGADGSGGVLEITFTEAYYNMNAIESAMCNGSLVYTLTSLDFITDVHIYVGEAELVKSNGKPMGILNRDNVVLDKSDIAPYEYDTKTITLYFSDEQAMGLVSEERVIEAETKIPLEKYIVEGLINGPRTEGAYQLIPQDTKLRPIKTENGVCYVDFTSDFIKKFEGGTASEMMLVYSIVNSLTQAPTSVKKVQILVDGERISDDRFQMDLSKPLERNENIILR